MTATEKSIAAPVESFGKRLRFARERRGLACKDVSKLLGVSERTFNRWEVDKSKPRANRMPIIAGTLNVHMRWLMSGEGDVGESNYNPSSSRARDRELLEEVRSIKEFSLDAVKRLAKLEGRLVGLAGNITHDEIDPKI